MYINVLINNFYSLIYIQLTKTLKTHEDLAEEVRSVKQKSRKALEESQDPSRETTSSSLAQDTPQPSPSHWGDTVDGYAIPSTSSAPQNLQEAKPPVSPSKKTRIIEKGKILFKRPNIHKEVFINVL